jgi:hypothetical protein
MDSTTKKEASSRAQGKVATSTIKERAVAVTPDAVKKADDTDTKIKTDADQEAEMSALAVPPPAQDMSSHTASTSTAQPRRSMTRTRKPSSRLLPSPSPPPARSSSYHNYLNKASAPSAHAAAAAASVGVNGTTSKNTQKKQQTANAAMLAASKVAEVTELTSLTTSCAANTIPEKEDYGPGKRKRRPSTMTKPPSTITKSITPSTSQAHDTTVQSLASSNLKVRISRIPSKSQTPEEKNSSMQEKTSKKAKADNAGVQPTPIPLLRLPSKTKEERSVSGGYESDGNREGALLMALAEPDKDAEHDEDSDAGATGKRFKKLLGGVRSKGFHTLSAAREKFGSRRWPTSSGSVLEPPPLISRRGGLKSHQGFSHASQRSGKQGSSESNHVRSQSTSVIDGKWAWTPNGIAPTLRFRLGGMIAGEDEHSEASDMEDEDDFHVAMLEGGDFAEIHHHHKATSPSSHHESKSGDDSETEDTPATTPRSPQSTCDLPERRWSAGVDEEEKESRKGSKDAVFAHALEPSSRRPHTHAGSLTLSLPFDEMVQANDEENHHQQSSFESGKDVEDIVVKEEEDEDMTADLLGPAVQPGILGLSTKQHALMLSSPHASSAFTSPAFDPSIQGIKSEPHPLALPPPVALSRLARIHTSEEDSRSKQDVVRSASIASGTHPSSDDDEEEKDEHAALAMEPPERMCLSELDRAWEQSEYLGMEDQTADNVNKEAVEDSTSTNALILNDEEAEEGEEDTREIERAAKTRGGKRTRLEESHKEEAVEKKSKASPKHKSPARSVGRRSARHSGLRV